MTKATIELIDQLCGIIDKSKYLILSGTMAVGKTYLANLIAEKSCEAKYCSQGIFNKGGTYEIETELISIHPSFYYEDFVNGIIIDTESGNINFHYADKVFLTLLKKANKSWEKKEDKKYFLILDDISRGAISGILGDMLPLIEPHGQTTYKTVLSDGETISVSPNVYIIATRSTLIDSVEQMNYGFLRHFYEYQLNNDYMYMCDSATDVYSDYDMSANAMFYRTKRIVTDYLRHRYQMSSVEKERYVIGHGMYKDTGTAMIARNQIIPLLRQYVKDNVLAKTANVSIAALQKLVDGQYSKDRTLADVNRIVLQKTGITADSFRSEGLTHQPLVNLVSRIKEQGLVDDTDIANDIMFNPQVVVRKKAKLDKVERDFPTPGYLYIEKSNRDIYTYGTTKNKSGATKRPRFFYSGSVNDAVSVDGIDYAIASEMQPGEYSRWYEELDSGNEENERYSSSPNSIMFRILRSYYRALSKHYGGYLSEYPGDENIARLKAYAEQEYKHLVSESRKLHPEVSDEKEVNAKANDDFRDVIHDLVLFWKDRGETISVGGQTILVEGVYKVDSSKRYEEYSRAMETLGIHQMIMQGPPGTSKTYSAREYLKYEACKVNGREISDSDLDALQIITKWAFNSNFERVCLSEWLRRNHPEYFGSYSVDSDTVGNYLNPRGWECSMIWSAFMGLPLSLAGVGAVLGLEEQKLKEGKDLIRYFCVPCKATKSNGGRTRNLPEHDMDKWKLFKFYNQGDVEVEQSIQKKLVNYPVPDFVWEEFWLDQEINARGIQLDLTMVENAISLDEISKEKLVAAMREITDLDNPNSVAQMKVWLAEQGVEAESLGKKDVAKLMDEVEGDVKDALLLRQ